MSSFSTPIRSQCDKDHVSRHTRSNGRTQTIPPPPPPTNASPTHRHSKKKDAIISMSDIEVWAHSDEEILTAHQSRWRSSIYDHYDVQLRRNLTKDFPALPHSISFIFTCKFTANGSSHSQQERTRSDSSTSNLIRTSKTCDKRRDVVAAEDQSPAATTIAMYNSARHRTLIALRCARNHRPFNIVNDPEYRMEVELLRPGTNIPSPTTISRDTQALWEAASHGVRNYFQKYKGVIHLAIDGWTSPIIFSYLGIIVIWYDKGKVWRATLDLSCLTSAHTGQYMAQTTYDVLDRYGLLPLLFSIVLDNASNCDTLVKALQHLWPAFPGMLRRSRCWPHVVNLIAKAFLALFFLSLGTAKKKAASGRKRKRRTTPSTASVPTAPATAPSSPDTIQSLDSIPLPAHSEDDSEQIDAEIQGLFPVTDSEPVDPGRAAQDLEEVTEAVSIAEAASSQVGSLTSDIAAERRMAVQIFPKVAGLARRVHDSGTLKEKFDVIVQRDRASAKLSSDKNALDRRVPTRWNSDLKCLQAHVHFESQVAQLIAGSKPPSCLKEYGLSEPQWDLAKELADVLLIFEEPTLLFSRAEVPLIHEVIPMMDTLVLRLKDVISQKHGPLHHITITAAKAALVVAEKYQRLNGDCELYDMSIVFCPDKKVNYFHDRTQDQRVALRLKCITRFRDTFGTPDHTLSQAPPPSSASSHNRATSSTSAPSSKWASSRSYTPLSSTDNVPYDTMEAYLAEPLVPSAQIAAAGGILAWWEMQRVMRPRITKMAIAYLTAPASSVDAERAFSEGRLSVNHLQHNMSSNTFRAKMALGSWTDTPLMPAMDDLVGALNLVE